MNNPETEQFDTKTHMEMWKHYDNLRQAKNSGFLTANSVLIAITGLLFKEKGVAPLILLITVFGICFCVSWFLLLSRNTAYIEFHRRQTGGEARADWRPKSWVPRSKYLDRTPCVLFLLFWIYLLTFRLLDPLSR